MEMKIFLNWSYPFEVLQERCRIIEDLLKYIRKGTVDQFDLAKSHDSWQQFEADVKSRMYEAHRPLMKRLSKPPKGHEGDTREILFWAFVEGMLNCSVDRLKAIPHFSSPELASAFGKKFNARMIPSYHVAESSVEGAYNQALDNFYQTEARLAAQNSLYFLLSRTEYENVPELLGFDAIRKTLWERRDSFLRQVATFGALLGGAKAAAAAQLLALELCHKEEGEFVQYSVVQFLMADGIFPSRWESEPVNKFREDIKRRFDALKEIE